MRMEIKKNLSSGEKKLLDSGKQILISEIMLAADMTWREAEEMIKKAVGHC